MVRFRGGEPNAEAILRSASRLAAQLNAQWYAVHVLTAAEESRALAPYRDELATIMKLAKGMGAETITLKDDDVAQTLIQFVRANGITHIVQGHPGKKQLFGKFRKSITEVLLEMLPEVHIIMI